ncbi:Hypothetical protein SCF082_LOCUS49024, partial [Durusdinium trenchii]
ASSALLSEFLKRRGELLSVDGEGPIDCVEYPFLCDQSLNCKEAPLTAAENETMNVHIAQNGKANLRSWCRADPMYAKPLQSCILDGNLDGYAAEMFRAQQEINLTGGDAIYCFAAKHCENDERSKVTTLEEARTFCDKLYGKRWKNVGWNDFMAVFAEGQEMATGHIPKDLVAGNILQKVRRSADISAMTACAMGNFQCDVAYCRKNFCNAQYQARYREWLWSIHVESTRVSGS